MFALMGNTMSKVTPAAEQYLFVHAHSVYFLNFFSSFRPIPSKWNAHSHTCWNTCTPTRVDCAAGVYTVYDSHRWSFPHGCNLVYSLTPLFACTYLPYITIQFSVLYRCNIIWRVVKLGLQCVQMATMRLWCIVNVFFLTVFWGGKNPDLI